MELIEINVENRDLVGSTAIGRIRREGKIPGVMYSEGKPAQNIVVDELDFRKKTAGVSHTHLYRLRSEDKSIDGKRALIKDLQIEPLKQKVLHFDLYEIHEGHRIVVTVPVELLGESPAVKAKVGIVAQSLYEVDVECQPTEIPEKLELDISALEIGHSLFVGDLKLPEGVKLKTDKSQNIVSVVVPKEEVAAAPVEAAAATTTATPAAETKETKPKGKE